MRHREIGERRANIETKKDYVKTNYLKTTSDPILEYVLAVPTSYAIETRDAIWRSGEKVILWLTSLYDLRLKIGQPPKEEPEKQRMMHHDHNLTRTLSDGIPSTATTFGFFPQSHTVRKMKVLLECIEQTEHGLVVPIQNLSRLIETQLFYLDESRRSAEMGSIVQEAERIGFISQLNDKGQLHVISRYRKRASLEEDLQTRWIRAKILEKKNQRIDETRIRLQQEILSEQKERPTLLSFKGQEEIENKETIRTK